MIEINREEFYRGEKVTLSFPADDDGRVGVALDGDGALFTYSVMDPVRGGYYVGGNAAPFGDMPDVRSATVYRSLSDGAGIYGYPTWVPGFVQFGGWLNLVLELKAYTVPDTLVAVSIEGRGYTIPVPDGTIQRNPKTTPAPAWSYAAVLRGDCDGLLHRALASFRAIPAGARVNIQLASEVDTDNEFGITWNNSPTVVSQSRADRWAVSAYTYMINWFRSPPNGIEPIGPNVTFSLGWAGQWSGAGRFEACHPDGLPVDYCHFNIYNHGADWSPLSRLQETEAYRPAGSRIASLPIIVAEWGTNAEWEGGQAAYIKNMPRAVRQANEALRAASRGQYVMMNYFSSRDRTWGKLDPRDAGLAALQAAYATRPFLAPEEA